MEDDNNIDNIDPVSSPVFPESIDPKAPYIELEPENELIFVEGREGLGPELD